MEGARDLAKELEIDGKGRVLDQFSNDDNWIAHYKTTGPEIWNDTNKLLPILFQQWELPEPLLESQDI